MRILFIAEGSLGDLLILSPAVRAVKKSFPQSFLSILIVQRRYYANEALGSGQIMDLHPKEGTAEVYINNPYVDEIIEINREMIRQLNPFSRILSEIKIIKQIRERNFDIVICSAPDDRYFRWAFISGAKIRIGENNQRFDFLLTNKVNVKQSDAGILKYFCRLAVETGAIVDSEETELFISEEAKNWAADIISKNNLMQKNLIALHPGSSSLRHIWPPKNYAFLIEKLNSLENTIVILFGTDFDKEIIQDIKSRLKYNVLEINDGGSVQKLAAVLKHCKLCISNDSGPRHLTIANGISSRAFMMF
ncbi:MAG: glycosyltransferase family 9 protein, partial [Promethearchaeota archaeon]